MPEILSIIAQILLLTAVFYAIIKYSTHNSFFFILLGITIVTLSVKILATLMNLRVINLIIDNVLNSAVPILCIIFFPEIRRALYQLGSLFRGQKEQGSLDKIVETAMYLSNKRHGALIAFERKINLQKHVNGGEKINAEISAPLLENIFYPNTPLHDGAVIIRDDKVFMANCFFTISKEQQKIRLGSRHRAAISFSQETDALVLVVSEETGIISLAFEGELYRDLSQNKLNGCLTNLLEKNDIGEFLECLRVQEGDNN